MNFSIVSSLNVVLIFYVLITENIAINFNQNDFLGVRTLDARFGTPQGHELSSPYDIFRFPTRLLRERIYTLYNRDHSFRHNLRLGKIQREITEDIPFPCNLSSARSDTPPNTVHELRPGDIDIIAALGDSMTAGTCLLAETFLQIPAENRGIAFSAGGYGNWRKYLTLPNILKVFNPKLYGYSIADSLAYQKESRFNVAEPVAMSRDLVHQTKILIKRMRTDPNVDMKNHWKLLTIFISNVDFCADLCRYEDVNIPLGYHEEDLRKSLTLLRDNVPRLFVNLIPAPNSVWTWQKMKVPLSCYVLHRVFCFCAVGANHTDADRRAFGERIQLWQDIDARVANLTEFNTDDFTVVFHAFLKNPRTPILPDGYVDQRYFAADCFHFSQYGHAALATTLWNSMMQPFGHKLTGFNKPLENFECPSLDRPYLATFKNSLWTDV